MEGLVALHCGINDLFTFWHIKKFIQVFHAYSKMFMLCTHYACCRLQKQRNKLRQMLYADLPTLVLLDAQNMQLQLMIIKEFTVCIITFAS